MYVIHIIIKAWTVSQVVRYSWFNYLMMMMIMIQASRKVLINDDLMMDDDDDNDADDLDIIYM